MVARARGSRPAPDGFYASRARPVVGKLPRRMPESASSPTPSRIRGWLASRWEALVAKTLVLVAVVVFVKLAAYIDRPVVDDALISMAYGKSLFAGGGLRVTPYSAISEGFSNPTWTLLLGLLEALHVNAIEPAKTIGMLLSAGALPLLMLWGPVSQKRAIQVEDALGPLLASTNGTFAYWALGGLENGILVFFIALFGVLVWLDRTRAVAVALGLSGAALALTRPEAPLYVAAIGIPSLIDLRWRARPRLTRNDFVAVAALLIPIAIYALWRRVYFGDWLPNTYYAKHAWYVDFTRERLRGMVRSYLEGFYRTIMPLVFAGVAGAVLSLSGRWTIAKTVVAAALVTGTMSFFVLVAGGDWMMEYRFLGTAVPFIAYPVGAGVTSVRRQLRRPSFARRTYAVWVVRGVVAAALLFGLWSSTKKHAARWTKIKDQGGDTPRIGKDRPTYGQDVRGALTGIKMTHPYVAAPDMGYISLAFRSYEIVDLAGLTDVTIARHYGNIAATRDFIVNEGYPTLMLMWGPSNNLWPMTDVLARYKSSPTGSTYKIYAKVTTDTDDRCPEGKPSALADTSADMQSKIRADLASGNAVGALARWRCYFAYRADAQLPSASERIAIAREAEAAAKVEKAAKRWEPALRRYSLCAVIGASSWSPSTSCRMEAERLRARLFPRPAPPKSNP